MKKTESQKTEHLRRLGEMIHDVVKVEVNLMCDCIFREQDAAKLEGRLRTRQIVVNDFKARSKSNLPVERINQIFEFVSELYEQTKN